MTRTVSYLGVAPGAGLVLRRGRTVVLVATGAHAAEVLSCFDGLADEPVARAAVDAIVGRLDGLDPVPAVAAVVPSAEGWYGICRGAADLAAERVDGTPVQLSSGGAVGIGVIPGDLRGIAAALTGVVVAAEDHETDLEAGLVHGGGFFWSMDAPSPGDPPADPSLAQGSPPPTEGQVADGALDDLHSILFTDIDRRAALEGRVPLPIEGAAPIGPDGPARVLVEGVRCARDHHNDPRMAYCARCGVKLMVTGQALVEGARPPLGVLTLDDGTTAVLREGMVLGREPEVDDMVVAGTASGLTIPDDRRTLSRAHARILLVEWDAFLEDCASANGTFVRTSPDQPWRRLEAGERVALTAGTTVRLGERELSFDRHQST